MWELLFEILRGTLSRAGGAALGASCSTEFLPAEALPGLGLNRGALLGAVWGDTTPCSSALCDTRDCHASLPPTSMRLHGSLIPFQSPLLPLIESASAK